jgi:hypothetical protein
LLATPEAKIQVGHRTLRVWAEPLSPEDGAQILLNYRGHHPFAARELSRLLGINFNQADPKQLQTIIRDQLPVIALHPRKAQNVIA